jgi:ATP-dependent DNA helicase RecG
MTRAETTCWLGQSESQTLEFKSVVEKRSIAEAVCGMLNSEGGCVVVGVSDDGRVLGIDNPDTLVEEIDGYIQQRISPSAPCAVISSESKDHSVLLIDVPSGSRIPYVIEGKVFVRVGAENRGANAEDIERLIQKRLKTDEHWERQPAIGMSSNDLDVAEIYSTMRQSVDAGRFDSSVTNFEDALRRLNLIIDGRPIQAAIVAFGLKLLPWYPQCTVRLARFKGVNKDEFVDQKKITGHAFLLLEEANSFLAKHLPVSGTFEAGNLFRQDRPLYPILALREALVNALCHRDYSIAGGAISVAIFDDRLEIASTGTLPQGVTVDGLRRGHYSQPRNPLIADLFYRRGLIELWGRGGPWMVRLCVDAGCPEPQFEERSGEFVVRFLAPNYGGMSPLGLDLTERQSRILAVLHATQRRSLRDLRESVDPNLSDSTIRNDLNHLRDFGLIEAVGVGRGAFWRVVRLAPPTK